MSATVLLSSYVIRVKEMWRQAPITAALVIAAGLTHHSKLSGVEIGLRRMSEVMLGCVMGLLVTWLISKIWPPQEPGKEQGATKPSSPWSGAQVDSVCCCLGVEATNLPGAESRLNSSLLPGAATFLRCLKPPARMSDMPPMKTKTSRSVGRAGDLWGRSRNN